MLYTLNPRILLNTGLTRPFTCIAPEGTVLNPVAPAAVGMRSLTCARLRSVIFGAFVQAIPDRMPAAPAGNNCIVNVMTRDERSQKTVNPVVGVRRRGRGGEVLCRRAVLARGQLLPADADRRGHAGQPVGD
ncbi:Hydantoinase B/oxoprolinase [Salipiger thiooxidans]|uniref:Hydantoinase B/oxoprolinase n=1 Tax=Salipiger thiooxidans TaxID=282683 RepID=A0A1G7LQM3_9RHOB|nr:Hydantoinase B/oxoprolinase [Salipiger thiooxidans]